MSLGTHDDLVDRMAGLLPGSPTWTLRRTRTKVVDATQGSHDALFDPDLAGLDPVERLAVAFYACRLTPAPALAAHYRERLLATSVEPRWIEPIAHGSPESIATALGSLGGARLAEILAFTRKLIERPIDGDKAALLRLPAAGLTTPAVVALAQLIAFLSYQTRVVAGLAALKAADERRAAAGPAGRAGADRAAAGSPAASAGSGTSPGRSAAASRALSPGQPIRAHGFTNETLEWDAWLDTVDLATATPEQMTVLEESHPKAKTSDYYLCLVHQPRILRERSTAFNAIMYAPGGLPRAERELASTVVSRINGCVYCASVHAQRFEQLARRADTIVQVFDDPHTAGTDPRERAIARFAIDATARPDALSADDVDALAAAGLADAEILDLLHSVAIFAWANRLMLNLGEPVPPAA